MKRLVIVPFSNRHSPGEPDLRRRAGAAPAFTNRTSLGYGLTLRPLETRGGLRPSPFSYSSGPDAVGTICVCRDTSVFLKRSPSVDVRTRVPAGAFTSTVSLAPPLSLTCGVRLNWDPPLTTNSGPVQYR